MRQFVVYIFTVLLMTSSALRAEDEVCRCETLSCTQCEHQTGVTFYTEKCQGGRLKSCQKPTCEPLREPPAECLKKANNEPQSDREVSSEVIIAPEEKKEPVGLLVLVRGKAQIHSGVALKNAVAGLDVFEKDVIETFEDAVVKVVMADKNVLNIGSNSKIKIRGYEGPKEKGYSSATIDLIYGKVRSVVVTRPKFPDKPVFRVRSPSAVAGVRGTDFVTSYMRGGDVTKVETLKGTVELSGYKSDQKTLIQKGQYASFVVVSAQEKANVATTGTAINDDFEKYTHKGFLTPVYMMTDMQYEKLNVETDYQIDGSDQIAVVAKASNDKNICQAPKGQFNQCAWVCKGNPAGEKRCRTDLEGVRCVRSRCDAGGRWSNEERLPANHGSHCSGEPVVAPCDY